MRRSDGGIAAVASQHHPSRPRPRSRRGLGPAPPLHSRTTDDPRIEKVRPGDPDYGISGCGEREGGSRWFRDIDMQDREERWAMGLRSRPYSWRTMVGPAPKVDHQDLMSARLYLNRIEDAIEQGGWTTSEAWGLRRARKIWRCRAMGQDLRYNLRGNKPGGMEKAEAAHLKDRRRIQEMIDYLKHSGQQSGRGRSNGD